MSSSPHILVFDSGVGGLSICAEIRAQLPSCSITYVSDNAYFPYGTKNEAELVERVHRVFDACVATCEPDIIVVACNTASTVALPRVRQYFKQAIVGVVPAIKPAAQKSLTKVLGLVGTPATVARPYTQQLIRDFAGDCRIIPIGSSELVRIAEKKLRGERIHVEHIREILSPCFQENVGEHSGQNSTNERLDTIVLACTHFPLLHPELAQSVPYPVHWIDSGDAIARRVAHLLRELELSSNPDRHTTPLFQSLFTNECDDVATLIPALQERLPGDVGYLEVD